MRFFPTVVWACSDGGGGVWFRRKKRGNIYQCVYGSSSGYAGKRGLRNEHLDGDKITTKMRNDGVCVCESVMVTVGAQ